MATILVLIPMRIDMPAALMTRALELLSALEINERQIGEHTIEPHAMLIGELGDGRPFSAHADARNAMLDQFFRPEHTHVLWIDADVVDYPTDLASRLHALDSDGIIAPYPLIEGSARFYDVYGFVDKDGNRARPWAPYLDTNEMQSVGTCSLIPAGVFHDGARYEPTDGHTEHMSVCRLAARVTATEQIIIAHADLPKWGEAYH